MAYCYRHPDRETGLSCSECERPICTDCATFAPVGIRCPDHAGAPQGVRRVATGVRRAGVAGTGALVTKALIGLNALVFLSMLGQGATLSAPAGDAYVRGALFITRQHNGELIGLSEGEWWRLLTAAFLHAGLFHLGLNMLLLWWIGAPLEEAMGRGRFLLLYVVSGLAGSAGALLWSPTGVTVGASGAVFGLLGAALILERRAGITGGPILTIVLVNLAFTFLLSRYISVGGHVGGLVGGALAMLAFSRFGRGHPLYGRLGALGVAGVVAVGIASVAIAYMQVERYV
jgi:membrane associated rhomboid family serine protease